AACCGELSTFRRYWRPRALGRIAGAVCARPTAGATPSSTTEREAAKSTERGMRERPPRGRTATIFGKSAFAGYIRSSTPERVTPEPRDVVRKCRRQTLPAR